MISSTLPAIGASVARAGPVALCSWAPSSSGADEARRGAVMHKKIAVFWPGDARDVPNQLALPNMQEATAQLERALKKLGRTPYLVPGFLSKPHHAIEKLGPIEDPMIGMCVHWFYGPHTTN